MFRDPTRNLLTAFCMAAAAVPATAAVSDIASAAAKPPAAKVDKDPREGSSAQGLATVGDPADAAATADKPAKDKADTKAPYSGADGVDAPAPSQGASSPQPAAKDKSGAVAKPDADDKGGSTPTQDGAGANGDSSAATDVAPAPAVAVAVVAGPVSGHVKVRLPGTEAYVPLDEFGRMPVGAVVDAEDGKVRVTAALPGGKRQAGTFWGGKFRVRQARTGLTELELAGALACHATGKASAAGKRTRRNRLWGKDRSGRFRTRGANSVATVRGTEWLVEDRCSGTLTRVKHGAVVVRDQARHKTVTLRAGERYLARAKR